MSCKSLLTGAIAVGLLVPNGLTVQASITPCNRISPQTDGPDGVLEYSNDLDWNDSEGLGALEPGRTIYWDGNGLTENGQCIGCINGISGVSTIEVDALANSRDNGFLELINSEEYLIVSLNVGAPTDPVALAQVADGPISLFYSGPSDSTLNNGPWVIHDVNLNDAGVPGDLDGFNAYGDEASGAFSDKVSLAGDENGVSIYNYDQGTDTATPYITQSEIFAAISSLPGLGSLSVTDIDVDALMVWDTQGSPTSWDNGDDILFSLAPVPSSGFLGNVIIHLVKNGTAQFLEHGDVVWDTNMDPAFHFGTTIPVAWDIDALEVAFGGYTGDFCNCGIDGIVPEPSSCSLAIVVLSGLMTRRWK